MRYTAAIMVVWVLSLPAIAGGQRPDLETLLVRAADYVSRYVEVLGNVSVEERYVQDLVPISRWTMTPALQPAVQNPRALRRDQSHRELRSDVQLIRVGPPLEWRMYRDVFEVNGKPVRDREDRLAALFMEPAATARQQSIRIAEESARFNISNVERTLNAPGIPLAFLQPALRARFDFTLDRRDEGAVWIVRYEERARPTVFQHNGTQDNPSTGRLWIDTGTGEVAGAEHIVAPPKIKATFTTTFRHDDRFGIAVPIELREKVEGGLQASYALEGAAKYTNYRKFEVSTEEATKPK